jgi:hypothetical protein
MRLWVRLLLAAGIAVILAAYAELVLDIRTPRSSLLNASALAAVISFPSEQPENKHLAGMYGLFVVAPGGAAESVFPFSIVAGNTTSSSYKPTVETLRDRFGDSFPAKRATLDDTDTAVDYCSSRPPPELGLGWLATWLRLRAQTFCIVDWNGIGPSSMLVGITLADGDPWMRPFARRICRTLTAAALEELALPREELPRYAACVLVDRADRMRPGDAQDTFKSVVYEVRNGTLARMD